MVETKAILKETITHDHEEDGEYYIYEYRGIEITYNYYLEWEYVVDECWYASIEEAMRAVDRMLAQ